MQPLDKVSCISAIKMNEFILYCSRFALPLQCRTMARTITTMSMARASAAMTIDNDGKFGTKWLAKVSRMWYNLWHKQKAGPIVENNNTTNRQLRYTYNK